ncbi:MAG TPA: hypothetical protein VJ925_07950 [Longimicrobiales bacterium]|nr:hypothetical protein [Longimicrobiales bacterium]
MHPHTLFRRARLACVALLLALTGAGCGLDISLPREREPLEQGFSGDWVGTFQGSEMILRVGSFLDRRTTEGRVIWRDVDWAMACSALVTGESSELECDVIPSAGVAFCGDPDPFVAIEIAEPRQRLEASVGGEIREGTGSPCDGPVITSWEPAEGVVFTLR